MAKGDEAKFSVVLDDEVSDSAENAARAVEALQRRMESGESAVKEMSAALRRLRGNTDEVKQAKAQLTARINAEKSAISSSQLAMLKHGDAAKKLAERTKLLAKQKEEAKERTKALGAAVGAAGGPVASLKDKIGSLGEMLGGAGGASSLMALGIAGLIAAVVALTVAAGAAVVALAKFAFTSANAQRSANLMREAAAGSAANATALGTQVDALARKVPTAKAALNELAISLAKGGIQGQALVDTFNAVGQASAALGDDAGAKLRELVDRGRLSKRFVVNPMELQGSGLQFDDIAAELAVKMKKGIGEARKALFEGRVSLGDGAAAMRAAVEKKFGGINLRRMLDINVIFDKVRERFDSLTSGINIEPLSRAFETIFSIFDDETVTGDTLKQLIGMFGNGLGSAAESTAPIIKKFFQGIIIESLKVGIAVLKLRNWFKATFDLSSLKGINWLNIALKTGRILVSSFAIGFAALVAITAAAIAPFVYIGVKIGEVIKGFYDLWQEMKTIDWAATGQALVDGFIGGIKSGMDRVKGAVKDLGGAAKNALKDALGIHSPSKVFAELGANTAEGYKQGVDGGAPAAAKALDSMAEQPSKGGAGRGSTTISIPITINVDGGGDAAKALSSPSFLAQLVKAIEDGLVAGGVPSHA